MTTLPTLHPLATGCPPAWASGWGQDQYGVWIEFTVEAVSQRMRWIGPGRFIMGSPEDEPERWENEGPQNEVVLTQGFWMFDTAVTQAMWQAVIGENPSRFKAQDRPVETVSWEDCQGFVSRINEITPGLDISLPTEAQWECACRAGTVTPFSFGDNVTSDQANYDGNLPYADGSKGQYREETVAVASLPPNPWGLHEMHGNVWEWCLDGLREYTSETKTDPRGSVDDAAVRVLRGGSWFYYARFVRSACRLAFRPGERYDYFGFRCLRVQQEGK